MLPEQIALVQESFKKVAPIADTAADIFYARLFEVAPQVRSMFPEVMTDQKEKLMQVLSTAVNNLHQVEQIVPVLETLGRKHVDYGVCDGHYDTVGEVLIYTLEKGLGPDFTEETKAAWLETYDLMASVMRKACAAQ